ncbi:MAG: hypothetical protein CMJ31_12590 [Phycisphaerae bacterium]|nr:hypothetical protein [Phycisphaerae bacterium]
MRTKRALIYAITAATLLGPMASGQNAPNAQPRANAIPDLTVDELVALLDHDDFTLRENTMASLVRDEDIAFEELAARSADPSLSLEQRTRLDRVLEYRYFAMPIPALGVRGGSIDTEDPVFIADTVQGFDAAIKLERNDAVLAVDGEPIADWEELVVHIMSYQPGETIELSVARTPVGGGDRETIEVPVVIGRYDSLRANGDPRVADRLAGLQLRLERLGFTPPSRRAGGGLGAPMWLEAEGLWPPPEANTPIGETGLRAGFRDDPSRYFSPSGQPAVSLRASTLRRPDLSARERFATRGIGVRAGRPPWWESLQAFRIASQQLAEFDARYLDGAPTDFAQREARAARMQEQRTHTMESLKIFREALEEAPAAQPLPTTDTNNDERVQTPTD